VPERLRWRMVRGWAVCNQIFPTLHTIPLPFTVYQSPCYSRFTQGCQPPPPPPSTHAHSKPSTVIRSQRNQPWKTAIHIKAQFATHTNQKEGCTQNAKAQTTINTQTTVIQTHHQEKCHTHKVQLQLQRQSQTHRKPNPNMPFKGPICLSRQKPPVLTATHTENTKSHGRLSHAPQKAHLPHIHPHKPEERTAHRTQVRPFT
jgi:hypothetical protein